VTLERNSPTTARGNNEPGMRWLVTSVWLRETRAADEQEDGMGEQMAERGWNACCSAIRAKSNGKPR